MRLHHDKHHQTYVDNLNKALTGYDALATLTVEELLSDIDGLPAEISWPCATTVGVTPIIRFSGRQCRLLMAATQTAIWLPPSPTRSAASMGCEMP